jgi:hypothetical protein
MHCSTALNHILTPAVLHLSAPVPNTYYYTSPKTRVTYMLNTSVDTAKNAEASCQLLGGHMVMFESQTEQQEVETALVSNGGLIPSFHMRYWIGLESTEWPMFEWRDRTVPAPSKRNYNHWDKQSPDNSSWECAAASWPEAYTNAWAWVDADCEQLMPYVCEISSTWPAQGVACCLCCGFYVGPVCLVTLTPSVPASNNLVHLPSCHPAEPKTVSYKSPFSQSAYILNTSLGDVYSHEAGCAAKGGHLVSFTSIQEQMEVEGQ